MFMGCRGNSILLDALNYRKPMEITIIKKIPEFTTKKYARNVLINCFYWNSK